MVNGAAVASAQTTDGHPLRDLTTADYVAVYKEASGVSLRLYGFAPHRTTTKQCADSEVGAVVLFHGGGWTKGKPESVAPHARYLASRGLYTFTAEYRLHSATNGVRVADSIADAADAARWVIGRADELGIDPERVVLGGGSAGGHLAASAALIASPGADRRAPPPDVFALVMFNPVLVLTPQEGRSIRDRSGQPELFGPDLGRVSPFEHVGPGQPPAVAMYGADDPLLDSAQLFGDTYRQQGNRFELVTWEDQEHGFYHFGNTEFFVEVCRTADVFLASLGLIEGDPTVEAFVAESVPSSE